MTATYTAEMIREAAPKTATGRKVAAWMLDLLEARGSAHFARVVRKNIVHVPNPNYCTAFEWDAWNTFRKLSDAMRAAR